MSALRRGPHDFGPVKKLVRETANKQKTSRNTERTNSMKKMIQLVTCAVVAAMSMEAAKAALNIPSDGSDGDLVISGNTVIDLSRAVPGNWDANNSGNAGWGIYDSNKWAVVFKYRSVNIQGGTVTFKNHASRAPVVWLVQSNVTINGTVKLDGQDALNAPYVSEPGPGGSRGGSGSYSFGASESAGFGIGGGKRRSVGVQTGGGDVNATGGGGSYGTQGQGTWLSPAPTYGNPSVLPLIGGSGGAGGSGLGGNSTPTYGTNNSGGGGGGAILIGSAGTLTISGTGKIQANGGRGLAGTYPGGGGSGGAIRLLADVLAGNGVVEAVGGAGAGGGGSGRTRIERVAITNYVNFTPGPSVVELPSGAAPVVWLPADGPTVRIVSVGGNPAPADPRSGFGAIGADVVLPRVTNITVVVETTYVQWPSTNQTASVVTVRATPRSDGDYTETIAAFTSVVSEDPPVARWTANVPVKDGYAAIQVKVVRP
jgi:hypothetical protein